VIFKKLKKNSVEIWCLEKPKQEFLRHLKNKSSQLAKFSQGKKKYTFLYVAQGFFFFIFVMWMNWQSSIIEFSQI
jgi:hypothetical protein